MDAEERLDLFLVPQQLPQHLQKQNLVTSSTKFSVAWNSLVSALYVAALMATAMNSHSPFFFLLLLLGNEKGSRDRDFAIWKWTPTTFELLATSRRPSRPSAARNARSDAVEANTCAAMLQDH